ncbi:SGNH/GDSL hydrolase family protein [Lachnospiraceae bacterium OttesenSCG-928-D06]|nr:SGNH/GDSL hydrolase family protein [Lachnospiraceae bacterium OttesenSCG-928-D06]
MFLCCFFFAYKKTETVKSNYQIVCLGDSIMGQVRDESSVTSRIASITGEPVLNGALGGTTMSRMDESRNLANNKDGLSMESLALAIGYQDFAVQYNVNYNAFGQGTEYFRETIDQLSQVDFSQTKIVIIGHGTNDYNGGIPITNVENSYDVYTFEGALRRSIETLQKQYSHLRILLVTPTYNWMVGMEKTCEEWNSGYGYLKDYVEVEIRLAEEYGIEVIDLYHDFYPKEQWEDWQLYTTDGIHPNEAGRNKIADYIASFLIEK